MRKLPSYADARAKEKFLMRLMGYVRVSGLGQKSGDGPQRQRDAITTFCATHKLELDPAIYEEAITGVTPGADRPQFSRMMARILEIRESGGEIDGFVMERADRLSRDMVEGELIFRECRKLDIKVYATDRGLVDLVSDDSNPTSKLIRQIISSVAEYEKSALVAKMKAARDRIRKEKGFCEGRKRYGTEKGEQQCWETIIQLHREKQNPVEIAATLNSVGFKTRRGGGWSRQRVYKMLKTQGLLT